MTDRCVFIRPWLGRCTESSSGGLCDLHAGRKCWCGAPAATECASSDGPLMCGQPICSEHECRWSSPSIFGPGLYNHSDTGAEQYAAWVTR